MRLSVRDSARPRSLPPPLVLCTRARTRSMLRCPAPCRVRGCRYASTHATVAHQCGRCGETGHGQLECRDERAKRDLRRFFFEEVETAPCDVPACPDPRTHARSAHVCGRCSTRGGCVCHEQCVRRCPMCNADSPVDMAVELFTGTDCAVCLQPGPVVVFAACRHAAVCRTCAARL